MRHHPSPACESWCIKINQTPCNYNKTPTKKSTTLKLTKINQTQLIHINEDDSNALTQAPLCSVNQQCSLLKTMEQQQAGLARGGAHPYLHKLAATRPTPDPKVTSLVNGKLKGASKDMTRDQLVEHCRKVIENQRPSTTVNGIRINGVMVGRQGNNMILHEHVMRMILHAKQPLYQEDIDVLRDFAQTCNQCKGLRILSKTYNGP